MNDATRKGWGVIVAAAGVLLALARLIVPQLPVFSGHSISEAHGYCNGVIGALVRGFGGASANAACNEVNAIYNWLTIGLVAGIVMVAAGVVLIARSRRSEQPA